MLNDCHSVHKNFHVLREKCHSYFTTFLVRPRNVKNNSDLLELETILNVWAKINVVYSIFERNEDQMEEEHQSRADMSPAKLLE
jgi:hypothetical protein